jgi:hypothetical protein
MVETVDLNKFKYILGDNTFPRQRFEGVNPSVTQD